MHQVTKVALGFCYLGHRQGMQKCLQILKHICATTMIRQVYKITLTHYQLISGLSCSILEDMLPFPWSMAQWVDQLHAFLYTIQGHILLHSPWHPPSHCIKDWFIMEDVLNMQVPKWQALQLQHVHIFLQVTMLSDIVNHCSTDVIPAILHKALAAQHVQHYQQNTSALQWPQYHPPGLAAWHAWRTFISWMYLQPNSFWLQHALGSWLPMYQQDFQWQWQICPNMLVLFHYDQQQWWAYMPACHYPTHIGYCNCCSPTSALAMMVPITPILLAFKIHISLPLSSIVSLPLMTLATRSLATWLVTPPEPWAELLWYNNQPHAHTDILWQAIVQHHIIWFVSNAAVHLSGYGTCTWIIRASQGLWTGKGYVPAPLNDMYSSQPCWGMGFTCYWASFYNTSASTH